MRSIRVTSVLCLVPWVSGASVAFNDNGIQGETAEARSRSFPHRFIPSIHQDSPADTPARPLVVPAFPPISSNFSSGAALGPALWRIN